MLTGFGRMCLVILILGACGSVLAVDPEVEENAQDGEVAVGETAVEETEDIGDVQMLGENLVRELWENIDNGDIRAIEATMGDGFQAMHESGCMECETELEFLRSIDLGEYSISDLAVTMNGSTLIATYCVSTHRTVVGEVISSDPAAKLSAWNHQDDHWVWIAHADLEEL